MGCKQTRISSTSVDSPDLSSVPVYVKSVLKKSRAADERSSISKQDFVGGSKSVNFYEQVEVKIRTPTPKLRRDTSTFNANTDDDDDGAGSAVSSVSSYDDIHNPFFRTRSHPRHQNDFLRKSNSVTVLPAMSTSTNHITPLPPMHQIQSSNLPSHGRAFRVRRKIQQSVSPEPSVAVASIPPTHGRPRRSQVQSASFSVERPLPNSDVMVVEHRASMSTLGPSAQPAYYAFSRRGVDPGTSTKN